MKGNISVPQLYAIAVQELASLSTVQDPDFRLEQAEFKDDDKSYEVVVSYLVPNVNKKYASTAAAVLASFSEFQYYRIYKKVKINQNGEVVGFYVFKE